MQNMALQKAVETCADPQRAQYFLEQLRSTAAHGVLKQASAEQARILTALLSGSQALSELLIAHPDWLGTTLHPGHLENRRQKQGLHREVQGWLRPLLAAKEYMGALEKLRGFKQREMLRIATRDLARLSSVPEITRELSDVADLCIDTVYQVCYGQLADRVGRPYHQDAEENWRPTPFCIFGLGKLGGQELNYSSDIDVIFVYEDEGHVFKEPPRAGQLIGKGLSNHQFFTRLAEAIIAEFGRMTPEGTLFRIDLRLRPEGNAGPLVRSLNSYENYYAQWGQTWERMMLIKARVVAGDQALGSEFLEMIQPFRFPRSLSERILGEVASMKERIESEVVKSGEIDRNVKLGRGGIREIEFVAQTLQLLHAGRIPFLQDNQTLPTLQKLVRYRLLSSADAAALEQAYCFLRDVEHRLQMENNLQTHTIPIERKSRERLAALMGFPSLAEFEAAKQTHTQNVRRAYDALLRPGDEPERRRLPDLDSESDEWRELLREHSFREPDRAHHLLREFVQGPGFVHVSPRTTDLALELVPRILALCPNTRRSESASAISATGAPATSEAAGFPESGSVEGRTQGAGTPHGPLSDPDRVVARLDRFVAAYGSRAMLYELWTSNPSLFELLLLLFDRSEFLAELAIRTPDLVDELELSGRLRRRKSALETLADLRHGLRDQDQRLWLRRYFQAELMRIGLRDILGLADFEQNLIELSALADACLQYALEVIMRKARLKNPPFVIIGLGKLGGSELNYGSDLDIMFVADPKQKNLPQLQRLATDLLDLLSTQTEAGATFPTDARLRPDGEKGLLVNTLTAYEEYYRQRAQLWEIQAISRTRPVAGDLALGRRFQEMVSRLTNFNTPSLPLTAYTPQWKQEIHKMRLRIEKERTPAGKQALAIKTGTGGLMDAEFIAQTLCLANGWQEPNTLKALERARHTRALKSDDAELLISNYRKLRRIEGILRRWSYAGETLLPDDPAPLYRVAVRCGFPNADAFMHALSEYRGAIRNVYNKVMEH